MSALRCSRRLPTRRGSCWRADRVRVAFLVPDPEYPVEWRWAYDAEAEALSNAGITVVPVPWTDPRDLADFDLVLPLVAWGYHKRYADWLACLTALRGPPLPPHRTVW